MSLPSPGARFILRFTLAAASLLLAAAPPAVVAGAPLDPTTRGAVEAFLAAQAAGSPGQVHVHVDDPANALAPCAQIQPFLPTGVSAWGRVFVGVRCASEHPWTRFLAARVTVEGSYLTAARALHPGDAITASDVQVRSGDLTALPRSVLTDVAQLQGLRVANAVGAGAPLRLDLLHAPMVVRQGQEVRVTARGAGFVVASEGKALGNAAIGNSVQIKMSDGRVLSATARPDGSVAVAD